jgi:hypothetical protein
MNTKVPGGALYQNGTRGTTSKKILEILHEDSTYARTIIISMIENLACNFWTK